MKKPLNWLTPEDLATATPARRGRRAFGWMLVFAGVVAAGAMVTSLLKAQSTVSSLSQTIPYQGYLEEGGAPVEQPRRLTFCLYRSESATECIWTESHVVDPEAGRFAVRLGSQSSLDTVLQGSGELWIGIQISNANGDGSSAGVSSSLAGRQLLGSVPFARRGAPGAGFVVDGPFAANSVKAASDIEATGKVIAKALQLGGDWQVSGDATDLVVSQGTAARLRIASEGRVGVGTSPDPGVALHVNGSARISGGHLPDYDSGWIAENTNTVHSTVLRHGFGVLPSQMVIQLSTSNDGSWARISSNSSPGFEHESPESTWISRDEVQLRFHTNDWIIYCDSNGWPCPTGVASSKTGFVRVLLWK